MLPTSDPPSPVTLPLGNEPSTRTLATTSLSDQISESDPERVTELSHESLGSKEQDTWLVYHDEHHP